MSALTTTTSVTTVAPSGTWAVDPVHSRVGFAVKHMGIATVRGTFDAFDGALVVPGDDPAAARIALTVEAASVNTSEEHRDAHLRSPDFFGADEFPQLTFESTAIEPVDEETFRVTGPLTMHGVTRDVELEAVVLGTETDPFGNERLGLEVNGQLSRGDFGMTFNQALGSGNVVVSDKVKLSLDVSAIRQA